MLDRKSVFESHRGKFRAFQIPEVCQQASSVKEFALSLQNLFSSGAEDFDDEDFLCALEDTESSFSSSRGTPLRLRPIPSRDAPLPGVHQQTAPAWVEGRLTDAPDTPSLTQDVDDDELLSVCSEVEEGVSQEPRPTPGPTLRPSNQTLRPSNQSSCSGYSPAFQLRPPRSSYCADAGLRSFQAGTSGTSPMQPQPYGFSSTSGFSRGRGQCQSPGPSAKRPCLRPSLETQPARPGFHLAPRCTTPSGPSGPGALPGSAAPPPSGPSGPGALPGSAAPPPSGPSGPGALSGSAAPPPSRTPLMSPRPHQCSTLQTPVVTTHLVQLVTAANKTPQKLAWETPPPKERRFPGPAGLLPQQGSVRRLDEIVVSPPRTPSHGARAKARSKENVASQQPMGDEYSGGPWVSMKAELSLDENDPTCFLRTYSVVMVLRKAALKQLPKNKVPRMAVALKSLTPANGDAGAVFRDATGEIQGTVHHLLLEEREGELKVGSVLLLRQVGVFSPSHRNHYLNVTPSNLVKIYPATDDAASKVPAASMTEEDVDVNANQTRPGCCQQAAPSSSSDREQLESHQPHTSLCNTTLTQIHPPPAPPRIPYPVPFHSSSCTTLAKASASPSSTAQPRTSQGLDSGDWEMDDLDSLLCELPEAPEH
ncbi:homologous recombination OB-fold protein [Gastrophryne carolinensis]